MNHTGTPVLETARLVLRPFRMEDAQDMYTNWASDPEVTKFLTWPTHTSVEVSQYVLAGWIPHYVEPDYYHWTITLNGHAIGSIAAVDHDDRVGKAHIGYCIGRKWWHMGIMTEALQAVMDYLFDVVGYSASKAATIPTIRIPARSCANAA